MKFTHPTSVVFKGFYLKSHSKRVHSNLTLGRQFLINEDLQPVFSPSDRPWRWRHFTAFWLADSFNVNTWQIAATGVQNGLSWQETWISVWIGYSMVSVFIYLSQRSDCFYHTSFPVVARSSFDVFGSIWTELSWQLFGTRYRVGLVVNVSS